MPRGRSCSARRSTSACGATRWCTATGRSTSSCASCGRSWSGRRRAGATSTRTSGSGTGSLRSRWTGCRWPSRLRWLRTWSSRRLSSPCRSAPEAAIVLGVGPDRNKLLRNFAILILLTVAVWQLPGGGTATVAINNILGLLFAGGLVFFGYRMYMEHRTSLFMLEDRVRALLYGSVGLLALALIATSRLFDEGGVGVLVWLALIGAGVYGCVTVYRAAREY